MTAGVLSRMTPPQSHSGSISVFCDRRVSLWSFPRLIFVIPAKAGIQDVFLSSNVREKKNIDSPLLISGITENENNREKERKYWIPNQVGDDNSIVFENDKLLLIPDRRFQG